MASTDTTQITATVPERIVAALPSAVVRETRNGYEVGGFSCPPVVAQRILREAGLPARDLWGSTVVDRAAS